jgi:hypothetical protein
LKRTDDIQDEDAAQPHDPRRPYRWAPVLWSLVVLVLVGTGLAGCGSSAAHTPLVVESPEGVAIENAPDLAPASTTAAGQPVEGITCRTSAQQVVKYHIHVHVAIYVNGLEKRIPAGAGIPSPQLVEHIGLGKPLADELFVDNGVGGCLYWLHVHSNDGVVHVESPYKHTFTLGQFFDIWGLPLGPDQVGPANGAVVAFENGRRYPDPRSVPLLPQGVIQLGVGRPVVAFQPLVFKVNGLCSSSSRNCAS